MQDTINYTRDVFRTLIRYQQPFIISGVYQHHNLEDKWITFTDIKAYAPGTDLERQRPLCDHLNVMMDNLTEEMPDWQDHLVRDARYCLVCYAKPYRDDQLTKRCGIRVTMDTGMEPIVPYDKHGLPLGYVTGICIDWSKISSGKWTNEVMRKKPFSKGISVQNGARHKKVLKQNAEKKRRQKARTSSIWNVINMKV